MAREERSGVAYHVLGPLHDAVVQQRLHDLAPGHPQEAAKQAGFQGHSLQSLNR